MRAKYLLLTHFSQRYPKLPRFNNRKNSADGETNVVMPSVALAFDLMTLPLKSFNRMAAYSTPLRVLFREIASQDAAVSRALGLEHEANKQAKQARNTAQSKSKAKQSQQSPAKKGTKKVASNKQAPAPGSPKNMASNEFEEESMNDKRSRRPSDDEGSVTRQSKKVKSD